QPSKTTNYRWVICAIWGTKDVYVNYVKFYKTSNLGKEHPFYSLHEDVYIYETGPGSENYNTTKTICTKTIPAYADYVYIFFAKETVAGDNSNTTITFYDCGNYKTHWYYSVDGSNQTEITPVLPADENFCGWVKIDCRSYTSDITLRFFISLSSSYSSSDESWKRSQIKIDLIDYMYTVDLTANANGYALYRKASRTKKYFKNNTYYKNELSINSDSSSFHLTKVNKADFVSGLYNSIATELRDNWLILTDVANKHYLLIDGVHTYIVQLFITSSYIKVMLTSGQIATLIQDTRYSSLSIYSIVAGSVESIETGHIIPKTTNRVIGQAGKEFQSAHINVITAPIIYSSSTTGYFKGKVYAG
ncbi:MAG: hypothetical protein ACPKM0_01090, partial [Pleomorphochaeta sp.]